MKTLGLIGGMSWESTAIYYRILNESARSRFGGLGSADLLVRSFDFERIAALQASASWDELEVIMVDAARRLEQAGAHALLICSNTMHKLYEQTQAAVAVPILHIADATANALATNGCARPLLLATRYTMEQPFLRDRLSSKFGLDLLLPDGDSRTLVHDIIYNELCQGVVTAASKAAYLNVIAKAEAAGADSVILGCTEICLLIGPQDADLPMFDTTMLHAEAAMRFAAS
jgi:aspartate racemase